MEPKPLLFPFLYEGQEDAELLTDESTSIYDAPVLRERLKDKDVEESAALLANTDTVDEPVSNVPKEKMKTIALKNRKLIQGVVLRNEFARLFVETEEGTIWIQKSQIAQIYD